MKTKHLIFELFICALIFISVEAIEQSKDGKQRMYVYINWMHNFSFFYYT